MLNQGWLRSNIFKETLMSLMTFNGGVHPPHYKKYTADKQTRKCPIPRKVYIPLSQHIGLPAKSTVKPGDRVKAGEKIGDAAGFISANIHSSVSGVVESIGPYPHFTGKMVENVIIVPDHDQTEIKTKGIDLSEPPDPAKIREMVNEAGIVGMGGAAFPTAVKLSPPPEKPIDSVIINACECEPFLTCDYRLMLESSSDLFNGLMLIMFCVGAKKGYIGIEDNKPSAIKKMEGIVKKEDRPLWGRDMDIKVCPLETKYPQGGEKQLIFAILNRTVPARKLPSEVGALVQNVGTTIAIYHAVKFGKPLTERLITITGPAIKDPHNLLVKLGTPVSWLIEECMGFSEPPGKVIMGGPMTGFALSNLDVPVVKGTSGVLALTKKMVKDTQQHSLPCVRCGKCMDICPMYLAPSLIGYFSEHKRYEDAEFAGATDCIECGSCVFICPAKRPLVKLIREAKGAALSKKKR